MARKLEPIDGIEGVSTGATPTINVPINRRLHLAKLYGSAAGPVYGADVIDTVYTYVGTRLMREETAQELLDIAKLNGFTITPQDDGIPLSYTEPARASVMDEQMLAWDLFNVSSMQLKVKLKSGLTSPALVAKYSHDQGFSAVDGARVRIILKRLPTYFNAGASYDITAISAAQPITRIYLYPEAGKAINRVQVKVNDSEIIHDVTATENRAFLEDYGLVQEVGNGKMFPIVFDHTQQVFDYLAPQRSLTIKVDSSAGGQIKALVETLVSDYV